MAVIKLIYYLIAPRKFYVLLRRVCRHELLLQCEVFPLVAGQALSTLHFELFLSLSLSFLADLPIAESLRQQVETIMNRCWLNTRRQLLFYLFTCIAIVSNYFITSFVINFYRYFTQPHGNYEVILRKLALSLPVKPVLPTEVFLNCSFAFFVSWLHGQRHDVSLLPHPIVS